MTTLKINKITKKYSNDMALDHVCLSIEPGIFGLLGPNGAGKSTLMRILSTIQDHDSGSIQYGDVDWKDKNRVKSLIGYLPQNFSLYKHLTVLECLIHLATLKGIKKGQTEKVEIILKQVNLFDVKDKKIGNLSGGMVRRVGIAQAILGDPQIIIVDEPTAGLDPQERIRFRNILHKIGENKIIILSSHIVEDIETLCNDIAILFKGKIITSGNVIDLKASVNGYIRSAKMKREGLLKLEGGVQLIKQYPMGDFHYVRYLSDINKEDSGQVEAPTLEDAYFYYMQGLDSK